MSTDTKKIKGYECKHAVYRKSAFNKNDDLLMVKEIIHYEDGTTKPNLRLYNNYQREFWVTKPGFRKHTDKKEWEAASKLQKFKTNQARLPFAIANALGNPGLRGGLRTLARSPFLYGCDVTTPVLIKQRYMSAYPDCVSENTVAVLDIETNVLGGSEDIIMSSITCKDKAFLVMTKAYLGTLMDVEGRVNKLWYEHLGEYIAKRNIKLEIKIVDTPGQCAYECIMKAHSWMPDFIAIYNINFDLPKLIKALERENYDIGDVFSDPSIPKAYRSARYIEGNAQRVTANGKVTSLHPSEIWHTMDALSSGYWICAMATYKKLRAAKGNEPSYKLDDILNKHLGIRKLKFDDILEQNHPTVTGGSLQWHQVMQRDYKLEYAIYNLFDCISVELLDEKTGDLGRAISTLCGPSEYAKFPSQPRRLVDNLHFFCLEKGYVVATTSDSMVDDLDAKVIGVDSWIDCVTL